MLLPAHNGTHSRLRRPGLGNMAAAPNIEENKTTNTPSTIEASIIKRECALCFKEGVWKWCGACKSVYYCSVEHQTTHWKEGHKKLCKRIIVSKEAEAVRSYVLFLFVKIQITSFTSHIPSSPLTKKHTVT